MVGSAPRPRAPGTRPARPCSLLGVEARQESGIIEAAQQTVLVVRPPQADRRRARGQVTAVRRSVPAQAGRVEAQPGREARSAPR
ncbi:hypothetical protein ACRAWF_35585 [Streptomyces sp. L7]